MVDKFKKETHYSLNNRKPHLNSSNLDYEIDVYHIEWLLDARRPVLNGEVSDCDACFCGYYGYYNEDGGLLTFKQSAIKQGQPTGSAVYRFTNCTGSNSHFFHKQCIDG